MSGICAVWRKEGSSPGPFLDTLLEGLVSDPSERTAREMSAHAGLGVCLQPGAQFARTDRVVLVCDADLLNEPADHANPGPASRLARLYEEQGDRFVDGLRGGFAVILWDLAERRLVAAVDPFGIKRLAWHEDAKGLIMASRADAVTAAAGTWSVNPRAIANVLNFSANLAPETAFSGVSRLQPGKVLTAATSGTKLNSYWDLRYHDNGRGGREPQLAAEMETVVAASVAAHCDGESTGRLGSFLSGGTDSSTVLVLMTRARGARIKAYSIGFEEEGFNELGYAEIAAREFGAEHITHRVNASECFTAIDAMVRSFDEPFGNSSAIATYFCAKLAADHGTGTLLAGDGGDELFGGNERYATDKIFEMYHSVPPVVRAGVIEPLASALPDGSLGRKARGYIRRAHMRGIERMLSFQFLRTHSPSEVFEPEFLKALGGYTVLDIPAQHYQSARARDHLDRLLYVDMKITLADNDLPKVTRMAALAGVRPRFPFLDRSVAEFAGRVPAHLKVKGLQKRYLFKRAFRRLLPAEVIRKKKHGFGIPVALWMKSDRRMRELTYDTLRSARANQRGYFRREFVEDLFRRHQSEGEVYYGDTLWTLLMLELWHRQSVDQPARMMA